MQLHSNLEPNRMRVHNKLIAFWKNNIRRIIDSTISSKNTDTRSTFHHENTLQLNENNFKNNVSNFEENNDTSVNFEKPRVSLKCNLNGGTTANLPHAGDVGDADKNLSQKKRCKRFNPHQIISLKVQPGIRIHDVDTDISALESTERLPWKYSEKHRSFDHLTEVSGRYAKSNRDTCSHTLKNPQLVKEISQSIQGDLKTLPINLETLTDFGNLAQPRHKFMTDDGQRKSVLIGTSNSVKINNFGINSDSALKRKSRFYIHPDTPNVPPDLIRCTTAQQICTNYHKTKKSNLHTNNCEQLSVHNSDYFRLLNDDLDSSSGSSLNSWMTSSDFNQSGFYKNHENFLDWSEAGQLSRSQMHTVGRVPDKFRSFENSFFKPHLDEEISMFALRTATLATGLDYPETRGEMDGFQKIDKNKVLSTKKQKTIMSSSQGVTLGGLSNSLSSNRPVLLLQIVPREKNPNDLLTRVYSPPAHSNRTNVSIHNNASHSIIPFSATYPSHPASHTVLLARLGTSNWENKDIYLQTNSDKLLNEQFKSQQIMSFKDPDKKISNLLDVDQSVLIEVNKNHDNSSFNLLDDQQNCSQFTNETFLHSKESISKTSHSVNNFCSLINPFSINIKSANNIDYEDSFPPPPDLNEINNSYTRVINELDDIYRYHSTSNELIDSIIDEVCSKLVYTICDFYLIDLHQSLFSLCQIEQDFLSLPKTDQSVLRCHSEPNVPIISDLRRCLSRNWNRHLQISSSEGNLPDPISNQSFIMNKKQAWSLDDFTQNHQSKLLSEKLNTTVFNSDKVQVSSAFQTKMSEPNLNQKSSHKLSEFQRSLSCSDNSDNYQDKNQLQATINEQNRNQFPSMISLLQIDQETKTEELECVPTNAASLPKAYSNVSCPDLSLPNKLIFQTDSFLRFDSNLQNQLTNIEKTEKTNLISNIKSDIQKVNSKTSLTDDQSAHESQSETELLLGKKTSPLSSHCSVGDLATIFTPKQLTAYLMTCLLSKEQCLKQLSSDALHVSSSSCSVAINTDPVFCTPLPHFIHKNSMFGINQQLAFETLHQSTTDNFDSQFSTQSDQLTNKIDTSIATSFSTCSSIVADTCLACQQTKSTYTVNATSLQPTHLIDLPQQADSTNICCFGIVDNSNPILSESLTSSHVGIANQSTENHCSVAVLQVGLPDCQEIGLPVESNCQSFNNHSPSSIASNCSVLTCQACGNLTYLMLLQPNSNLQQTSSITPTMCQPTMQYTQPLSEPFYDNEHTNIDAPRKIFIANASTTTDTPPISPTTKQLKRISSNRSSNQKSTQCRPTKRWNSEASIQSQVETHPQTFSHKAIRFKSLQPSNSSHTIFQQKSPYYKLPSRNQSQVDWCGKHAHQFHCARPKSTPIVNKFLTTTRPSQNLGTSFKEFCPTNLINEKPAKKTEAFCWSQETLPKLDTGPIRKSCLRSNRKKPESSNSLSSIRSYSSSFSSSDSRSSSIFSSSNSSSSSSFSSSISNASSRFSSFPKSSMSTFSRHPLFSPELASLIVSDGLSDSDEEASSVTGLQPLSAPVLNSLTSSKTSSSTSLLSSVSSISSTINSLPLSNSSDISLLNPFSSNMVVLQNSLEKNKKNQPSKRSHSMVSISNKFSNNTRKNPRFNECVSSLLDKEIDVPKINPVEQTNQLPNLELQNKCKKKPNIEKPHSRHNQCFTKNQTISTLPANVPHKSNYHSSFKRASWPSPTPFSSPRNAAINLTSEKSTARPESNPLDQSQLGNLQPPILALNQETVQSKRISRGKKRRRKLSLLETVCNMSCVDSDQSRYNQTTKSLPKRRKRKQKTEVRFVALADAKDNWSSSLRKHPSVMKTLEQHDRLRKNRLENKEIELLRQDYLMLPGSPYLASGDKIHPSESISGKPRRSNLRGLGAPFHTNPNRYYQSCYLYDQMNAENDSKLAEAWSKSPVFKASLRPSCSTSSLLLAKPRPINSNLQMSGNYILNDRHMRHTQASLCKVRFVEPTIQTGSLARWKN